MKDEANDLKTLSGTLALLSKLVHLPPDPPIESSDAEQIPPHPPDPPPTTVGVSTQVDEVIFALSQVDTLLEKSRHNKAREVVSDTSSKTARKLKKLRLSSEDYDEESQILGTCRNDRSHDTRNRQRELCGQLLNLVGGMHRMLKGIEKGFAGCKASIQGLVFRPLGELLCDLEQYCALFVSQFYSNLTLSQCLKLDWRSAERACIQTLFCTRLPFKRSMMASWRSAN